MNIQTQLRSLQWFWGCCGRTETLSSCLWSSAPWAISTPSNAPPPRVPSLCNAVSHVHGTPVMHFQKRTLSNILLCFTACGMTSAQFDSTKRHLCPQSPEDRAKPNALLDVSHTHKTLQTAKDSIQSCRMHWQHTIDHFAVFDEILCNFVCKHNFLRVSCKCFPHRGSHVISNNVCKWVSNFMPWEHNLCLKELASSVTMWCNTRDGLKQYSFYTTIQ